MRFKSARAMPVGQQPVHLHGRWWPIHPVHEDICTCCPGTIGGTICDDCVGGWLDEWDVEVIENGEWIPINETLSDDEFHLDNQLRGIDPDDYWFLYAGKAPGGEFLLHHCSYESVHRDECDNVRTEFDACLDESLGSAIVRMFLIDVLPEKPTDDQMIEILQNSHVF